MKILSRLREPVNGLTHLAAAALALIGLAPLLYLTRHDPPRLLAMLIYGSSLVLLLSSSAAYHLINAGPRGSLWLRKLDHTAIYLLIAGTYTPVCLHFLSGAWRTALLAVVWSIALVGIAVKLFVINAPRWVTAGIYLVMGWLAIVAIREIVGVMPPAALAWLIAGGAFFSVGAVGYILKKPDFFPGVFGFHEVWHIFVILGCLSHYILILRYVGMAS